MAQLQAERFKAELRARRRAKGESLQTLYQDITRLVQLTYTNVDTLLATHVGKEAFIAALDNANLQLEVMKREPPTVEIALGHTTKLEAYEQSLTASAAVSNTVSSDSEGDQAKHWPKNVFAVTGKEDDKEDKAALRKHVEQLEEALELATKGVLALAAGGGHATLQNAAATAGAARGAALQKSASRGGASARASGRGKSGHRGGTVRRRVLSRWHSSISVCQCSGRRTSRTDKPVLEID